ncbi:hypothetical protein BV898_12253 [Hypsibius exemplaris]|uniref:CAS1 domain-containing protein 1 n=1 Tax=Hypsibius exemplaris TaxID=2072580 RepID=A0A1W0WE70_HYPEX|nr:hypothetical protein BV898_12253 [Hypsibius exemplaris]
MSYLSKSATSCRETRDLGLSDGLCQQRCDSRNRTTKETVDCMRSLALYTGKAPVLAFAGDSRIRQMRDEFIHYLTGQDTDPLTSGMKIDDTIYKTHAPRSDFYSHAGVHVHFSWSPYLNKGKDSLKNFLRDAATSSKNKRPTLLVMGSGVWAIRDCARKHGNQTDCAKAYKRAFSSMLPLMELLSNTTDIIWLPQAFVNEPQLRRYGDTREGVSNANLEMYNNAVKNALDSAPNHTIKYWHSAWQTSARLNDTGFDGLHFGKTAKHQIMNLLLNWLCSPVDALKAGFFGINSTC